MKRKKQIIAILGTFLFFTFGCKNLNNEDHLSHYNILLICVDDLRPELGCYGNPIIQTPNIDKLASSGYVFNNHYVQSAICGPSRSSLLTGKVCQQWDPWGEYRKSDLEPDATLSLPHLFKKNGYNTIGIGKITHEPGGVMDEAQKIAQIPFSWDTTYTAVGKWDTPWRAFFAYSNGDAHNTAMRIGVETPRLPYEAGDVDDEGYPDGLNTLEAIKQLGKLKEGGDPFLLALGYYKPHLPFNAPKKYWDMYERNEIPMAENNFLPENLNSIYSVNKSPEVTTHYPWPDGPGNVSPESAKTLKHGYYASVSYIDALVGKVLDELDRLDLSKNTIVLLWSDHGWHLGEHTMFGKMSNFEIATRSPMIIRVPGITTEGKKLNHLLPALPNEWHKGHFDGVCVRGGFELDIKWKDKLISSLEILSKAGETCKILADGDFKVMDDLTEILTKENKDGSIQFETTEGKTYKLVNSVINN